MIPSKALRAFKEKYNRSTMEFISNMSKEPASYSRKFKAFNINEAFDGFSEYITEYGQFKVKTIQDIREGGITPQQDRASKPAEKPVTNELITERTKSYIRGKLFKETNLWYAEAANFVSSYIEGLRNLQKTSDEVSNVLLESTMDNDSIGNVNVYTELFVEQLDAEMKPVMDYLLQASGYDSNQAKNAPPAPKKQEYFL